MNHIIITLTGNSNKKLDAQARAIVKIIRESGSVKAGPIPLKGKRIVHIYNCTSKCSERLMYHKIDKSLSYDIDVVEGL